VQVTLDVKQLLGKIKDLNPEADLRGLKAWLFDLVFDEEKESEHRFGSTPQSVNEEKHLERVNTRETTEEKNAFPKELVHQIPPGIIGEEKPTKSSKVIVTGVGKLSREEKLKKRQELKEFTSLSGKEMADRITSNLMDRKEKKDGQFVDEGQDGPPVSNDDFEIG
jgi:hypothetical protein